MQDQVNARIVQDLAKDAAQRVVDLTIKSLSSMPSVLAGEDAGLGNVWLEFCVQVQGEHSVDWDDFELMVQQTIEGRLFQISDVDRRAIWVRTPAGRDWLEDPDADPGNLPVATEDLVDHVYGKVCQAAADSEDRRITRYLYRDDDGIEDADDDYDDDGEGDEDDDPP